MPRCKPCPAPQGARRFGSTEAPPIDWIIPPHRRTGSAKDEGLSEIFAYHATTVGLPPASPCACLCRLPGL